jgi:FixJ family two-component response regulator
MTDSITDVVVLDDDPFVRKSLEEILLDDGFSVNTFQSAEEFLIEIRGSYPTCAILDVSLPGLNGFQLQQILNKEAPAMPIIVIAEHGDIPLSVQAMKNGAAEFLSKPFSDHIMLEAVRSAVGVGKRLQTAEARLNALRARYARLTLRERSVLPLVVSGLANKNVGFELGISEITVKAHRSSLMRKLEASSLASLIQIAIELQLDPDFAEAK